MKKPNNSMANCVILKSTKDKQL